MIFQAQIPVSALTNEELAEKKKVQRKVKRVKEKEKKKENEIQRKEEDQKDRFLQLSDREKVSKKISSTRRFVATSRSVS